MESSHRINHPFLPQTEDQILAMLQSMNFSTIEDLYSGIPSGLRFKGNLNLPEFHSEQETLQKIRSILKKNITFDTFPSFLGAGIYSHFVPSVVPSIVDRAEFKTAYTPYAPEVSQGMLQALWEYQSMIAELTQLDLVNSSMYDLATALGEAALMSTRVTRKKNFLVPEYMQPERFKTLLTYAKGPGLTIKTYPCNQQSGQVDLEALENIVKEDHNELSGIYIENPNFWGVIEEEVENVGKLAHDAIALFIIGFDPISLGILKSPGDLGADIAIGEGQSIGLPMSYGGPLLGLFAVKNDRKLTRAIPGRIIGLTTEQNSTSKAFTMTLQTREQHIRREKATSNICTNNALCALASTVYLSLIGPNGLKSIADACMGKAKYLAEGIEKIDGINAPRFSGPFFKEFVFTLDSPSKIDTFASFMKSMNLLPGFLLDPHFLNIKGSYLTTVTEMTDFSSLNLFIESIKEFFRLEGGN